jgi:hypothetical protein
MLLPMLHVVSLRSIRVHCYEIFNCDHISNPNLIISFFSSSFPSTTLCRCLDHCMQFINKNAYIQTAIYGYSFCHAAGSAFQLILRNALRVAAVNTVADFLLLLGKIFISCSTTLVAYLSIAYGGAQVNGLLSPLIFVFLISYFVASMFTEIFGMGIETILCCYIADEEMFEDPDKRYAEASLRATMSDTQKKGASNQIAPEGEALPSKTMDTEVRQNQVAAAPSSQNDGGEVML